MKRITKIAVLGLAVLLAAQSADAGWGSFGGGGSSGGSWGSSGGSNGPGLLRRIGHALFPRWGNHSSGGSSGRYYNHGSSGGYAGVSHGSWGSYGSHGGGYGGSSGSYAGMSYGSTGSYAGASYGSTGSSYGGYGSVGSSYDVGYGGMSYGSAGGSYGATDGSYGYPMEGTVIDGGMPADGMVIPSPGEETGTPAEGASSIARRQNVDPTSAVLAIRVPADSKVSVNGRSTRATGSLRRFVSRGLQQGFSYTYDVEARFVEDGKEVVRTETVTLQPGESRELAFGSENSDESIAENNEETQLTLHVPEDAKVFLAGKETLAKGAVRQFATRRLKGGRSWADYHVVVEVEREGQRIRREKTISLRAGESRTLEVNFDDEQLASAESSAH